jgi:hypothetical protein
MNFRNNNSGCLAECIHFGSWNPCKLQEYENLKMPALSTKPARPEKQQDDDVGSQRLSEVCMCLGGRAQLSRHLPTA